MLFTSEFSTLLWQIKRELNCSHKVAYHLARRAVRFGYDARLSGASSVFATWSYSNAKSVAGHFWGLSKAYKETGDAGRSIAFHRAANTLYAMSDALGDVSVRDYMAQPRIGESIAHEAVEFYLAAHTTGFTPRTVELIVKQGAASYERHVRRAAWRS